MCVQARSAVAVVCRSDGVEGAPSVDRTEGPVAAAVTEPARAKSPSRVNAVQTRIRWEAM